MLEVVSVSREDELRSLRAAREIGVDWVLGGTHASDGVAILDGVKYCPFPGTIEGHPSVLKGSIEEIAEDAARLTALEGVHGLDLLAYRHATEDPIALTSAVVGSRRRPGDRRRLGRSRFEQIAALEEAGAWGFTIGSAIFAGRLPGAPSVAGQVDAVLAAMDRHARPVARRAGPPGPARGPRLGQARARRQAPERERDRRPLRRLPRDRPRGRARPDGGRLPRPPPRLRHLRHQGAAQPPRAGHDGLLHGDDPRGRPRAERDRDHQGHARRRPTHEREALD